MKFILAEDCNCSTDRFLSCENNEDNTKPLYFNEEKQAALHFITYGDRARLEQKLFFQCSSVAKHLYWSIHLNGKHILNIQA